MKDQKDIGLYSKFIVTRADGKSDFGEKHYNCPYFVIDMEHDEFAVAALKAYAEACKEKYPRLSEDLLSFCNLKEKK